MLREWGICLKRYEKESFVKSFMLFFGVQFLFLTLVMWQYHKSEVHQYDMHIMHEMTECSYTLACSNFEMDFVPMAKEKEFNKWYEENGYYMLFTLPNEKNHALKLSLSLDKYHTKYEKILFNNKIKYLLFALILLIVSALFARFAIRPLRDALELNDEFVKDMLHDFNTPLSSLKINHKLLEKKFGEESAILRSEEAMKTLADLQSNMHYFLSHSPLNEESIELSSFIQRRVLSYEDIFKEIKFELKLNKSIIRTNPEALSRILDNLLSNACKYNRKNGTVIIILEEKQLSIADTGIGIREPQKVFERFYKETSRGMGIGLHVVQKLCDDLKISIEVESELNKGTRFTLNLEKVMLG